MSGTLGATSFEDEPSTTIPDISFGSLEESFKSPAPIKAQRFVKPPVQLSASSTVSTRIRTPSPNRKDVVRRISDEKTPKVNKQANGYFEEGNEEEGQTDTDRRWQSGGISQRNKRGRPSSGAAKGGVNMTLREQEKVIDSLKKENFSLKLKVHFLEERLAELAPDHIESALKQNINLKIEVQSRGVELKKYKKLLLEMEKELQRSQHSDGNAASRVHDLEAKLEERERELRDIRRRKGGSGRDDVALREAHARNEELEQRQAQLEAELQEARELMQERDDEIERLHERRVSGSSSIISASGESRPSKTERQLKELEEDNQILQEKLQEFGELLVQREEEKEELADANEGLRLQIEEFEQRREDEALERSQSRAAILEEREEREELEDSINSLRDRLAAAGIELQQREDDLATKNDEIEDIVAEHEAIVLEIEQNWRGEVEEARQQVEEMRDILAERDVEAEKLRHRNAELEDNTTVLHDKFEAALAHLEQEAAEKDAELEATNRDIEKLGNRIWVLEDEAEKWKEDELKRIEEDAVEKGRVEMVIGALKDKLAITKEQLQDAQEVYEACQQDIVAHRQRQEELGRHAEDLAEELEVERQARDEAEEKLRLERREWEDEERKDRRIIDETQAALNTAKHDLELTRSLLKQRESDLAEVQSALTNAEAESRRAGDSATSDRFSLGLELDRARRDLARLEEELARVKKELEDREDRWREREGTLDKLYAENRDLAAQLAAQAQARLNVSEKLDLVQAHFRTAEGEVATLKAKVNELETRLSKDQRNLFSSEQQYRDQLTERNTLLLTIYQYMDKILGVDKATKGEAKPFTNFTVFHDNLISRLKALSQIQLEFDKRCKEAESKFQDRLAELRKQLDTRWKQIDRFETSVKNLAEIKHTWRRKYNAKEGELDAVKATNGELSAQVTALRRHPQTDQSELRALTARATNAERRLGNAQNQLAATEEKIVAMNEKTSVTDNKWEARVKEYESRLRVAEERVKRERQGGKERINELEAHVARLQRQLDLASKRNQQLGEVVESTKPAANGR